MARRSNRRPTHLQRHHHRDRHRVLPPRPDQGQAAADEEVVPRPAGGWNLISAASGLAVQELDQPRFRMCKPLPLFEGKRSEGVDQDPLSRDVHHVAGVDPATGTPGESDAPLEHGGLGRMESVLVRADGRSAGGTDPAVPVTDRVPGPDLAPEPPHGRCSSSRHAQHSLPQRVARHSHPSEAGAGADRKPGPLQAGTIASPAPKWGQFGPEKRGQFRPLAPIDVPAIDAVIFATGAGKKATLVVPSTSPPATTPTTSSAPMVPDRALRVLGVDESPSARAVPRGRAQRASRSRDDLPGPGHRLHRIGHAEGVELGTRRLRGSLPWHVQAVQPFLPCWLRITHRNSMPYGRETGRSAHLSLLAHQALWFTELRAEP
ncbi:hypothetical protein SRB17_89390 [Streptomyces sp. RB17]|nr:hypothetical protein [Streptomyces sp. RB17]